MKKGCQQGSILGPTLWNATVQNLLRRTLPAFASIQAYAHDIAVMVGADTRLELLQRSAEVLSVPTAWGTDRSLVFSAAKSRAILLKGVLFWEFTLPLAESRIATVPMAIYLGVRFDQNTNFDPHVLEQNAKKPGSFLEV